VGSAMPAFRAAGRLRGAQHRGRKATHAKGPAIDPQSKTSIPPTAQHGMPLPAPARVDVVYVERREVPARLNARIGMGGGGVQVAAHSALPARP
jgi:hypothetical protein